MDREVILVGAFNEIVELAIENDLHIKGYFDNIKKDTYLGYPVLGTDNDAGKLFSDYGNIKLLISPDQPKVRERLFLYYSGLGYNFLKLISKGAQVSTSASVDEGSVVQSLVNISSESQIGKFVKLNTLCNIMHNSKVGDFTTVAPNAVLLGYVTVGARCYIGSNSTILPNLTICDNVVIGAGAVVTKSIHVPGTYTGCPAVLKKLL